LNFLKGFGEGARGELTKSAEGRGGEGGGKQKKIKKGRKSKKKELSRKKS